MPGLPANGFAAEDWKAETEQAPQNQCEDEEECDDLGASFQGVFTRLSELDRVMTLHSLEPCIRAFLDN